MLRINAIAAPTKNGSTIESIFVKKPNIYPIRYKIKTRNIKNIIPSNIFLIWVTKLQLPEETTEPKDSKHKGQANKGAGRMPWH